MDVLRAYPITEVVEAAKISQNNIGKQQKLLCRGLPVQESDGRGGLFNLLVYEEPAVTGDDVLLLLAGPPGASRAGISAVGVPAANVAVLVIGAAISFPSGAMK